MKDKKIEGIMSVSINVSSRATLRTTTTRSAENLLLDIAEDAEMSGNANSGDDETVKRSHLSKKPNEPTEYLTFLRSGKKMCFS